MMLAENDPDVRAAQAAMDADLVALLDGEAPELFREAHGSYERALTAGDRAAWSRFYTAVGNIVRGYRASAARDAYRRLRAFLDENLDLAPAENDQ